MDQMNGTTTKMQILKNRLKSKENITMKMLTEARKELYADQKILTCLAQKTANPTGWKTMIKFMFGKDAAEIIERLDY